MIFKTLAKYMLKQLLSGFIKCFVVITFITNFVSWTKSQVKLSIMVLGRYYSFQFLFTYFTFRLIIFIVNLLSFSIFTFQVITVLCSESCFYYGIQFIFHLFKFVCALFFNIIYFLT